MAPFTATMETYMSQPELDNISPEDTTITLDKPRELRYNLKALRDLLRKHGTLGNIFESLGRAGESGMGISDKDLDTLADLLAAGLKHEDESITGEFVLEYMTIASLGAVVNSVVNAITKGLPKANPQ